MKKRHAEKPSSQPEQRAFVQPRRIQAPIEERHSTQTVGEETAPTVGAPPNLPQPNPPHPRPKKSKGRPFKPWERWVLGLSIVLACLLAIGGGIWIYLFSAIRSVGSAPLSRPNPSGAAGASALVEPYDERQTHVLLIGVDNRDVTQTTGNSDTMMILTLDQEQSVIKLTSFQRDMLVKIPGWEGYHKLNAAMQEGPERLLETLNQNFKLDLQNYIIINLLGAEDVIDRMGGIELEMPDDEAQLDYLNRVIWDTNKELEGRKYWADPIKKGGLQQLNGRQAISYARLRKLDSDFMRMQRQQLLLKTLFNQFKGLGPIQMLQTLREGLNLITTNMGDSQLISLGWTAIQSIQKPIETLSVPIEGAYEEAYLSSTAYIIPHLKEMIEPVHQFLYGRVHDDGQPLDEFIDHWHQAGANPSGQAYPAGQAGEGQSPHPAQPSPGLADEPEEDTVSRKPVRPVDFFPVNPNQTASEQPIEPDEPAPHQPQPKPVTPKPEVGPLPGQPAQPPKPPAPEPDPSESTPPPSTTRFFPWKNP